MLEHIERIERLKAWRMLDLPSGVERLVHQNRLRKIAREGGQMTPVGLATFESQRRYPHWRRSQLAIISRTLCHESDLRIEQHYTDTAGFTGHVFALTHLLGCRFAPRVCGPGNINL